MPQNDAFALKNSGLNTFLFADVGTEQNGSPLTVLSVLGRLGKDPWAQAAEWAKMPSAARIDGLTYSIAQMPLSPGDLADARVTAGRLVLLLPQLAGTATETVRRVGIDLRIPEWLPMVIFGLVLAAVIAATSLTAAPTTPTPAGQPVVRGD